MVSEKLKDMYEAEHLEVRKFGFVDSNVNGVIIKNIVYQSDKIEDAYEENVVRAHEYSHYLTNTRNLFEADRITQKKFERLAEKKTVQMLCPLDALIRLYNKGIRSAEEMAEELEVTSKYVFSALNYYKVAYGNLYRYKEYEITFLPLEIKKAAIGA